MRLIVLNVSSPFRPVRADSAGLPEQLLTQLDAALVRSGHESIVMAPERSIVQGILLSTPKHERDEMTRDKVHELYRYTLRKFLEKWPIDLIHMHGADFAAYLPDPGPPVLATLYLPPHSYPPEIFKIDRPRTFLHCITSGHRAACPDCANLLRDFESEEKDPGRLAAVAAEKYIALYQQLAEVQVNPAEAQANPTPQSVEGAPASPTALSAAYAA